jgi:catechol 2,3-dioxygenase-like lactoylglutathione lyase family enzyme
MAVELNHTIVPAHDPQESAQFLADILGLPVDPPLAHFTPVTLHNGVSLDFDHYDHVNGARGAYFRDPNGHLMEILTPVSGEPA